MGNGCSCCRRRNKDNFKRKKLYGEKPPTCSYEPDFCEYSLASARRPRPSLTFGFCEEVYNDFYEELRPPSIRERRAESLNIKLQKHHINLDVFSSTSYLDAMLRHIGIVTPLVEILSYTSCQSKSNQLSFLEKLTRLDSEHEVKEIQFWTLPKGDTYMQVVILEPEIVSEDGKDTKIIKLGETDIAILRGFMQKTTSFENSIFVLNKGDTDYDLSMASAEIAKFLNEDNRTIFKNVFDSKDKRIAERIEACLNQILTTLIERQIKGLPAEKTKIVQQELEIRKDVLPVHQFKTVALRHQSVKGFGWVNNRLSVFLKRKEMTKDNSVRKYLNDFAGDPPEGFELVIEHRKLKFERFTRLEQGSQVVVTDNQHPVVRYGSVGLFLKDDNDTYFLTTCAHVIGKDAIAYSPMDNSKIGQSVLAFESEMGESEPVGPWIDFSLVRISPEGCIECKLGIKTTTDDHFTDGKIFQGDILNMRGRMVYKWGATEPHLAEAKCLGVEEEDGMLILVVGVENFAQKGDSGCIVCVSFGQQQNVGAGIEQQQEEAVFVLVGGDDDQNVDLRFGRIYRYLVFRVQDALDKVVTYKESITPCLQHCTVKISPKEINCIPPHCDFLNKRK